MCETSICVFFCSEHVKTTQEIWVTESNQPNEHLVNHPPSQIQLEESQVNAKVTRGDGACKVDLGE